VDGPIVVVRQPGKRPLRIQVTDRLELGRDCDGLVLSDPQVSRRHAELRFNGDCLLVADLGSRNGTYIDDEPLTAPVELRLSRIVRLGATTVELAAPETAAARFRRTATVTDLSVPADDPRRTSIDAVVESALADGRQPSVEAADGGTVTILFSDIESSTELATSLGDIGWYELLETHNRIFRAQLTRFGGSEVKSQGDGFMLTFPSARRAVRFAVAIQRSLEAADHGEPFRRVRVRMGLHTGEAIIDDSGDLFGQHVIIASRIANLAVGGEILVSSLVREIVSTQGDIVFHDGRTVGLKGIEGTCMVHPVDWRRSTAPV
jgi:adenylate cyclase